MKLHLIVLFLALINQGCSTTSSVSEKAAEPPLTKPKKQLTAPKFKMPDSVQIKGEPFQGKTDAPVTLVIFSDFQCPHCAHFANHTLPLIEREYITTGRLRFIFRDLPYEKDHIQAKIAAVAAHCAGEQNKFWQMHNLLFADPNRLDIDDLNRNAKILNLNEDEFQSCMQSGRHVKEIHHDLEDANKLEIKATPTFFFGFTPKEDGTLTVKGMMTGSQPVKTFRAFIDALLKKAPSPISE